MQSAPSITNPSCEQSDSPFFVVGVQRSGTTMLRLMLNRHPRLAVPFETDFTGFHDRLGEYGDLREERNVHRLLDDFEADSWSQRAKLVPSKDAVLSHPIASYPDFLRAVYGEFASSRGKPRWGDKTPGNVSRMDLIHELFPDGKFVHIVRDGRDVAGSSRRLSWGSSHIPRIAEDWRWKTTMAHKMGRMIPEAFLEIRYEDLVLDPATTLGKVCGFLGEEFDPAMLEYHETANDEMPADSLQWHRSSVAPIDRSKVYAWRRGMSRSDRVIFDRIAGSALDLFGYDRPDRTETLGSRAKWFYYTLVRRW